MVIANKIDLIAARTVPSTSGVEFANEVGCPHYEVSARDNYTHIERVFATILETAVRFSMINQISRFYQKEYTGNQRDTRERKSSFKTIVKTLTRQKMIKEEIKEETVENQRPGKDALVSKPRQRSNTCNF